MDSHIGGAPPRLLFVNRCYWPDHEATGQLLTELCEDLADHFEVHVICGMPQKGTDRDQPAIAGTSDRRGVHIHRLRHTRFGKSSFWGRVTNMVSFQMAAVWRAVRVPRPDVIVVETDPPMLCLLGRLVQAVRRSAAVCYIQDIYPDIAVALGKLKEGLFTRALRRLFFRCYRRADAVVVLSRDMRQLVVAGGVPADSVHVIPNWVDVDAIHPVKQGNAFRDREGLEEKFVVMYSGNMGMSQGLSQVLDAADQLADRDDIVFAMVGDGADRPALERAADERRLSNVRFYGYQPKSELADSLSAADLHLVILRPHIKQLLMPSKLYGVLASGTPAAVLADADCELAEVVANHDLGAVIASADTPGLVTTIDRYRTAPDLCQRQGAAARAYAETHCRRSASTGQFRELLLGLAR